MSTVAVLHPGSMGAAVGRELSAHAGVGWLPEGRSPATRARAEAAGLVPFTDLGALLRGSDVVFSICPPGPPADAVADLVLENGFGGVFVEANAISPDRVQRIAGRLGAAGITVVDAGIVGPPPTGTSTGDATGGATTMYLSGDAAAVEQVHRLLEGSGCRPHDLRRPIGAASALKMAYASYNKSASVLAGLSYALAAGHGLEAELLAEASRSNPGTPLARPGQIPVAAAKAWRWGPEFAEMAESFGQAGLAPEVSRAVATVLEHWAGLKDDLSVTPEQAVARLRGPVELIEPSEPSEPVELGEPVGSGGTGGSGEPGRERPVRA